LRYATIAIEGVEAGTTLAPPGPGESEKPEELWWRAQ